MMTATVGPYKIETAPRRRSKASCCILFKGLNEIMCQSVHEIKNLHQ
jgi:hypothetical protein